MRTREEYIAILQANADELQNRFGITYMRLFGSVARNQHNEDSDVDLFVVIPPVFYTICEAADFLENLLGCRVDVVRDHNNLKPLFKQQIEKYGIDIFRAA